MFRTLLIASTALALSACGGLTNTAETDAAAVRAQITEDLTPAYSDIAAFCLGIIEGRGVDGALLTRHGFKQSGSRFELTWQQGKALTGLRVRARSPKGCSVDTDYNPDFTLTALESNAPLRTAWTDYLTAQGYDVGEMEREDFAIRTTDGQTVLEIDLGGKTTTLAAINSDHRIKIATYSNDNRTTEYMEVWD